MQGRKRFLAALLCLCALLMALPQSALAAETGESAYRVVIDDEADLLTEAQEADLHAIMEKVLPYGNAAFVSVDQNATTTERLAETKFLEFFGDTSGALLAAKNAYAAALLPKSVSKVYVGVCEGIIKTKGTVDKPIRLKEGHTIERETGEGGVRAVTHYEPLLSGNGHTLLRFTLETGRTHQIRVHMSSIGNPLAGDDLYGGSRALIGRQALHCAEVSFVRPISNEEITVKAPLPEEFERLVKGE